MRITSPFSLFLSLSLILAIPISHASSQSNKAQNGGLVTVELWCVAKNNAEDTALQTALDWACGPGSADCTPIQQGGPCYDPKDVQTMASYAFNDYYLKHGLADDSCYFDNTAALTSLNPSHDKCKFSSSFSVNNGSLNSTSTTVDMGPANADMSSCGQVGNRWGWALITIYLFFTITRII